MDDEEVERYLGCLGSAVFTAYDHCSLASKSFARVSSIAVAQRTALARSTREGIFGRDQF